MSRKNGGIIGPANTPVGGLFKGVAGGVWRMNDVLNFVGNNQWPTGPKDIENSCRFDDGSSDNLSLSVSGTSQSTTGTISFWFKRANISADQRVFVNYIDANNYGGIKLQSDDKLEIVVVDGGSVTGKLVTTQVFRDTSAWYHCVVAIDSSNGTAGDRMRLYINGSEVTSFDTDTNPSSSATMEFFTDGTNRIGQFNSSQYFDGYLAEFVMIHGQQLTPSSFGETDSTTGIWKPKKIGQIANAGDNSFYLDFKDSSSLGKDQSGLGNDFTVNNLTSIDQSTDTCVENFSTMNPLVFNTSTGNTFAEGNLQVTTTDSAIFGAVSSMGVSSGKWYMEVKPTQIENKNAIGVTAAASADAINNHRPGDGAFSAGIRSSGDAKLNGSSESGSWDSFTTSDIVGIALDLDNNKLYFSKNGTFMNSGDPTSGATGTGAISLTDPASTTDGFYFFAFGDPGAGAGTSNIAQFNFGSPPYTISSGNSDANGYGNFEYSVPTGYYALNTKNLAQYG